jgi:hypothetical protein
MAKRRRRKASSGSAQMKKVRAVARRAIRKGIAKMRRQAREIARLKKQVTRLKKAAVRKAVRRRKK